MIENWNKMPNREVLNEGPRKSKAIIKEDTSLGLLFLPPSLTSDPEGWDLVTKLTRNRNWGNSNHTPAPHPPPPLLRHCPWQFVGLKQVQEREGERTALTSLQIWITFGLDSFSWWVEPGFYDVEWPGKLVFSSKDWGRSPPHPSPYLK